MRFRRLPRTSLAGLPAASLAALLAFACSIPVRAQDAPPERRGRIIIRTQDGEQVIDLDPSQLPPLGEGNQVIISRVGPDGKVMTFAGDPAMMGLFNGANGLNIFGANGLPLLGGLNVIDPGRSYIPHLLKREDVRAQLYITPRQREQLDGAEKSQQDALREQIKGSVKFLGDEIKTRSTGEVGATTADLGALAAERAAKMREQMQNMTSERDKKIASILTPQQLKRLQELDMQWRGPLAMGVKDVAEQAKLTSEQAPVITDLLKQYRKEVSNRMNFGMRPLTLNGKPQSGATSAAPPPALNPSEMQAKMEQAQKEIEKARKSLGDKALNGLGAEQRAEWQSLTGKPFTFRTNGG